MVSLLVRAYGYAGCSRKETKITWLVHMDALQVNQKLRRNSWYFGEYHILNNQTGYYHFRVWRGKDKTLVGQQLSIYEYQAYINAGWHIISFQGLRGTVLILIEDMCITKIDCLQYAIAFMEGKLTEINVNLNTGERTTRPVEPPP